MTDDPSWREYSLTDDRMVELLREKGYDESAWAERFPEMLRFLL